MKFEGNVDTLLMGGSPTTDKIDLFSGAVDTSNTVLKGVLTATSGTRPSGFASKIACYTTVGQTSALNVIMKSTNTANAVAKGSGTVNHNYGPGGVKSGITGYGFGNDASAIIDAWAFAVDTASAVAKGNRTSATTGYGAGAGATQGYS